MTDGYDGKDEQSITKISEELRFIRKGIDKIEKFVDNFDALFDKKYEDKKKGCRALGWCENGIEEFNDIKEVVIKHLQEHETSKEMDKRVLTNRKWLIGIFCGIAVACLGWIITGIKYIISGGVKQ